MKIIYLTSLLIVLLFGCESSILEDTSGNISFNIPQEAHVKITIENSYNTLIKTLLNENKTAGYYIVNFDISNLAKGVYYYTIEAKGTKNDYYNKVTIPLLLMER